LRVLRPKDFSRKRIIQIVGKVTFLEIVIKLYTRILEYRYRLTEFTMPKPNNLP